MGSSLVLCAFQNATKTFFLKKTKQFSYWFKNIISFLHKCYWEYSAVLFPCLGGNIKADQVNHLQSTIKRCLSICGTELYSITFLLDKVTSSKFSRILKDNTHPLFLRISFSKRREGRLLSIRTKTERHLKSFIPRAIRNYKIKWLLTFWLLCKPWNTTLA